MDSRRGCLFEGSGKQTGGITGLWPALVSKKEIREQKVGGGTGKEMRQAAERTAKNELT